MQKFKKIVAFTQNLCGYFFDQKRCLACQIPFTPSTAQDYLCQSCTQKIHVKEGNICKFCGHNITSTVNICIECINNTPPWDKLNYYGNYDDLLKHLILKYKFSATFSLLPLLSHYLYKTSSSLPNCDLVIPMPRHNKRLQEEGFNHILELCRPLAQKLNTPLNYNALIRTRHTVAQSSLPAKQRKNNPSNSFQANHVAGKNVLLVDDVMTTGSTLRHASTALQKAQANKIYIAIIARVKH